jgi:hypothetical protein
VLDPAVRVTTELYSVQRGMTDADGVACGLLAHVECPLSISISKTRLTNDYVTSYS